MMKRPAIIFALCCALMGCGSDSSPSTPTIQPANLVMTNTGIEKSCIQLGCTLEASIQNIGTGCASGTAVVARPYGGQDSTDVPMMATGEPLASRVIRPNDTVALTSVSMVPVLTAYRIVPTWTNVKCS
jgi:hypothetical protein